MKYLSPALLLLFAIFANANLQLGHSEMSEKEMFLTIIECSKQAIETGLPEINLPSHDPLIISKNVSVADTFGPYSYSFWLGNMSVEGIPWFNVTQFDQVETDVPNTDVFNYTYYWKIMTFNADWSYSISETENGKLLAENAGKLIFEMDHVNFTGQFNLTKPEGNEYGIFNELTFKITTKEIQLDITNAGVLVSVVTKILGPILSTVISNLDLTNTLTAIILDRLNTAWLQNPARVQALIDNCQL